MSATLRITVKDLKLRIRDRSVFILGILAPLVLSYIFYLVFGSAVTGTGLDLDYGVVDEDHSDMSATFTSILEGAESEEVLELEVFADRGGAESALEDGDIDAFFVIPSGLEQGAFSNQASTINVVGDVDAPTSTQIASAFAEQFSSGVAAGQLAITTTARVGDNLITPEWIASLSQDPAVAGMSYEMVDQTAVTKQLDAATYLAAGMAVFFLFFTVQFGVDGLLEEEREGTLPRLLAAPISRMSVVLGKMLLAFILGIAAMTVLVVATSFLMDANWGNPVGVALLIIAGVLAAVGIMGLVYAVAKTPEGAGNLGSIIAVILGMLGGTFFPIASAGGFLSTLSYLTPHAWFLGGLADLSSDAPWTDVLPAVGAIMLFAVITGFAANLLIRRRLAR